MSSVARLWLINATQDRSALGELCQQARAAQQVVHLLHRAADLPSIITAANGDDEFIRLIALADDSRDFPPLPGEAGAEIVFLPCTGDIDWTGLQQRSPLDHADALQLIAPVPSGFDPVQYQTQPLAWFGWRAGAKLARRILREPAAWRPDGLELVEALQHSDQLPRWQSIPVPVVSTNDAPAVPPVLTMDARVLVVISYFKCEEWLHACLTSMNQQTRPPENIVVIDDCSPALPVEILERFPNVTLLSTTRNIGPEKILNNIVRATDYDAYLVQDPDDWSTCDRLELSLRYAEQTGADLVGTQELTVHHPRAALEFCTFPPDVNHAAAMAGPHNLLHCAGLFSRALIMRVGGFDENLKLGADTDFIVRAWHAGRIVNLPSFCVFHRVRPGSLTTHDDTGHQSIARRIEAKFILVRVIKNLEAIRTGRPPNFVVQQKTAVGFVHRQGPKLRLSAEARGNSPLSTISDV